MTTLLLFAVLLLPAGVPGASAGAQTTLAGTWTLDFQTALGATTATMIIKVDGGSKLTGQFSSPMFGNQELTGFVSGQEFEFSIDGEAGAIPFKCVIEDANSIKGSFDNPGVGNSGTFVGKRKT